MRTLLHPAHAQSLRCALSIQTFHRSIISCSVPHACPMSCAAAGGIGLAGSRSGAAEEAALIAGTDVVPDSHWGRLAASPCADRARVPPLTFYVHL